jgi:hypothetical protein
MKLNADLFRIAYPCASIGQARYYLAGVFIHPAKQGGAYYVATNGHALVCLYDPEASGVPDAGVILSADKRALGLMKRTRGAERRNLTVKNIETGIWSGMLADIASNGGATDVAPVMLRQIDGYFPDWRRVVPQWTAPEPDPLNQTGVYNAQYLDILTEVSRQLAKLRGSRVGCLSLNAKDKTSPALVRFNDENAFGVIMPLADRHAGANAQSLPVWF